MKNVILIIAVVCFLYGWYIVFFDWEYLDEWGNVISKKDYKKIFKQEYLYH